MKFAKLMAVALACVGMAASGEGAQKLSDPNSTPSTFDYYQLEEAPSPSDLNVKKVSLRSNLGLSCDEDPGCEAAPDCGCEAAPDCGCEAAPSCGCEASCNLGNLGLGNLGLPSWKSSCINIGGWIQSGYSGNEQPFSDTRGDLLAFNDSTGDSGLDLHQAWVYVEKTANANGGCWDWGVRADFLYGTDAQKTQAFGNSDQDSYDADWDHGRYGSAIPQAYVEVAKGNLSVKAGHFFTIVGYEVIPATGNRFFSHSFTMFNGEPFTHTGALATYTCSDSLEFYGGWVAGWDTGFEDYTDRDGNEEGSMFLGGFSISNCCDTATLTYITYVGDFGWRGSDGYGHSLVLDMNLCNGINYVVQSDYVHTDEYREDTIGINQYMFCNVNDCLTAGVRIEWYKDDAFGDGVDDVYSATFGLNYKPLSNVVVRPEVRHNWDVGGLAHDDEITVFGVDTIVSF
ncbi:MAG: hypothetical protein CMJ81_07290 [Planctomycetaceae bacterium]|nr:hypothetical protein [Planctomycetaceae bacterium]